VLVFKVFRSDFRILWNIILYKLCW